MRVKTALLSYGMSGKVFHGPLLKAHPGFEVSAVFHRSKGKNPDHEFRTVHDIDSIFDDPEIELVIVNTPNHTHFPYTKRALETGKHVIVEKPFTVTVKEADELIQLAHQKNKTLTVFHNRRWDGGFITVRSVLENKVLGRVVEFELHYDRYRNYIEEGSWKEENTPGTGILYNLGSHMIDQVLVLFGWPEYVDARMGIQRTGGRVIDFYDIRIQYAGLNVIIKSSYLVREPGPMYRINGTEGSFVKFGIDPQEEALKQGKIPGGAEWGREDRHWWGKINANINGKHVEEFIETAPGNYLNFYNNVYDVICEGKAPAVMPEQARDVIALIEACIESSQLKRAVKV
jgi:scyllo-inositol 2-dehydrogenase (NADP+)